MSTTPHPTDARPTPTQRQEMEGSWAVHGSGVLSPAQARGSTFGTLAGAAVGALIGAVIGLIPFTDLDTMTRVLIVAGCMAVAGATLGFILGGGLRPDAEGETKSMPEDGPRTRGERRSGQVD